MTKRRSYDDPMDTTVPNREPVASGVLPPWDSITSFAPEAINGLARARYLFSDLDLPASEGAQPLWVDSSGSVRVGAFKQQPGPHLRQPPAPAAKPQRPRSGWWRRA